MADARYLLVTTTRAAWLLDAHTGEARLVDEGRGVYYGISFSQDRVFIACRQADVGTDREGQRNVVLCFDAALRPTGVLHPPMPVRDVHQICYHAGTLFICSTFDDAVICHDTGSGAWRVWRPFGPSVSQDQHHINSVTVSDAGILLAGNRPSGWVARFERDGTPAPDSRTWLGAGTHNVWFDEDALAVCSSDEGAFRTTRGDVRSVVARGWLRGHAADRGYRYVGVSQNLVRGVRERSDCMVLRLDAAGAVIRAYAFAGFGMLHDLRVVDVPDDSHNKIDLRLSHDSFVTLPRVYMTETELISLDVTCSIP